MESLVTGRTLLIGAEPWLYFAGTSYLGIPHHREFKQLLKEGIDTFGAHFGGSRHSNIQLNVYDQAEELLAKFLIRPRCLLTSSGTLAGQIVAQYLAQDYHLFYAHNTHTALRIRSARSTQITESILASIESSPYRKICILTNSMDPLYVKEESFDWIYSIPGNREVVLVVDDSHGIGITHQGRGVVEKLHRCPIPYIIVGSLAKAFGIPAGFIGGDPGIIEGVFQHPLFIGSSPPPPAYLYAFLHAQALYKEQLSLLQDRINYFKHRLDSLEHFSHLPNYPVFYTQQEELFPYLQDNKILISQFSYPTAESPAVTRVVLNASHTREDISHLLNQIKSFYEQ